MPGKLLPGILLAVVQFGYFGTYGVENLDRNQGCLGQVKFNV
jgi:hypothetical protein